MFKKLDKKNITWVYFFAKRRNPFIYPQPKGASLFSLRRHSNCKWFTLFVQAVMPDQYGRGATGDSPSSGWKNIVIFHILEILPRV